MEQVVYDSGALIAIDTGNELSFRRHLSRMSARDHVMVPAPVAAQVVRDPRRQTRLMTTLRGCDVMPFEEEHAGLVGRLLARSGTSDVVDGFVAVTAAETGATIVTSDQGDVQHLLGTLGVRLPVLKP
ncbi:MAG TPA: PIN domain-containing protein [Streptosporangiaceae bacterium]